MKILVVGANGQIGRIVVDKLQTKENTTVIAGLRKDDQIKEATNKEIETVKIDLSGDIDHLAKAMEEVDGVVFTAGSGGHTGADKTMMIDLDGAVKTIEAAKQANVSHFVMVSAVHADRRDFWSYAEPGADIGSYYYAAKYYADQWLLNSGLNYTIIRSTLLLNEAGTGKVTVGERLSKEDATFEVPREDVAEVIIETFNNDNAINKAFDLTQGEVEISTAIESL